MAARNEAMVLEKLIRPLQSLQIRDKSSNTWYGSRFGFVDWRQKKDFHRRECVKEGYAERMRLNAEAADKQVANLPRDSNPIRLVDRCVMTSRARGVRRKYRVSRIVWRDFADHGQISGVTRSSW